MESARMTPRVCGGEILGCPLLALEASFRSRFVFACNPGPRSGRHFDLWSESRVRVPTVEDCAAAFPGFDRGFRVVRLAAMGLLKGH